MFKIWLNGMWSKDYVQPLSKVLGDNLGCDVAEALEMIKDLGNGKRMSLIATSVGRTHDLACDLMQYGCYIEVEQVGPLTDQGTIDDFQGWFADDQSRFSVVMEPTGHVFKIIEEQGYGYLDIETQAVRDWVGEELVRLGARRLDASEWPAVKERLDKAIAENEVRRMKLRAERAAAKKRFQASGGHHQEEE